MQASVILIRCAKTKKAFGARIQKMDDGDWWRTWAFPIDEKRAEREGYDRETIRGNLCCTKDYGGCPYCGTEGFVQCPKCGKLTCWNGESSISCQWCNYHMNHVIESRDKFAVSGGDA